MAAEEGMLIRHNMLIQQTSSQYINNMSSADAVEWLKAIDIEIDQLQRQKTWEGVKIAAHGLS